MPEQPERAQPLPEGQDPNNMSRSRVDISETHATPVSVVVPCYRCGKTVGRAVASVAAQTRPPQEVILVDDASDDDTLAVLRALQEEYGAGWIRIVALSKNGGVASARNAGWDAATGDYIAFLDADDAWHPHKLEIQHRFMAAHPEYALTGHGHWQVDDLPDRHTTIGEVRNKTVSYRSLLLSNRFITPSIMLRRDVPLRFRDNQRHMEDFLLWLKIAASGRQLAYLDCRLAYIFKAPFGQAGLSDDLLAMEKGELGNYWELYRAGDLGLLETLVLSCYSCLKFLRRIVLTRLQRLRAGARHS